MTNRQIALRIWLILSILLGTGCTLRPDPWTKALDTDEFLNLSISNMGNVAISGRWSNRVMYYFPEEPLDAREPIRLQHAFFFFCAAQNDVWIISFPNDRLVRYTITTGEYEEYARYEGVNGCSASEGGDLIIWGQDWVASYDYDDRTWVDHPTDGIAVGWAARAPDDRLWIVSETDALYSFEESEWRLFSSMIEVKNANRVYRIWAMEDGIWIGTQLGVYWWAYDSPEPQLRITFSEQDLVVLPLIKHIQEDAYGNTLIIGVTGVWSVDSSNLVTRIRLPNSTRALFDVAYDPVRERIYAVALDGLYYLDVEQIAPEIQTP